MASKLLPLMSQNYSFFMTNAPNKGTFFNFFPENEFSFPQTAYQKQTKVPGVRVETILPGRETSGWCNYDRQSLLKPQQN